MKFLLHILILLFTLELSAQGPYSPAAGQPGTTAIHKDSSFFLDWAWRCRIQRGLMDMTDSTLGHAAVGDSTFAMGKAQDNGVVSLGDGGVAVVQFNGRLYDGPGYDFAVFENSFSDNFLELAFVEVSSDGNNYFRFPSVSLTDTSKQVKGFDTLDPTYVHNLAGKYRAGYGTPFDLNDLRGISGLDLQNISHVRIIDVVGSMNTEYASRDSQGRKINDPFPTPFPSSGFDLDAVGVAYLKAVGLEEANSIAYKLYPNPVDNQLNIQLSNRDKAQLRIISYEGRIVQGQMISRNASIDLSFLSKGVYILQIESQGELINEKIYKL